MAASLGGLPKQRGNLNYALNEALPVVLACAALMNIGHVEANTINVTGAAATVTSLGVAPYGATRRLVAGVAFTYGNGTSLAVPGGANYTCAVGDVFEWQTTAPGSWNCVGYALKSGKAIAGGVINWNEGVNNTGLNATVPIVWWTPNNANSGVDVAIVPKGANSAFQLAITDGTTLGGNKRGGSAVDLQLTRGAATDVAAASNSFIGNGLALAIDQAATYAAIVGGGSNQALAAALFGFIGGGYTNIVDAPYGTIPGGSNAKTRGVQGTFAFASGLFVQNGDAQTTMFVLRGTSAGGTSPINLTTDGAPTPSATNCPNVTTNGASGFSAYAVGHDIINGSNAVFIKLEGLVTRNTGGGLNIALVGTPVATTIAASTALAGTTLTCSVNTTLQCLVFTGTSVAGSNLQWVIRVFITEEQG